MNSAVRLVVLVIAALVAFAANSLLARVALGDHRMGAAVYAAVRLLSGAGTLAALVRLGGGHLDLRAAIRSSVRWRAAAALFAYAIAFSAAYLILSASTGALILFATVQLTILGWAFVKGDRLGPVAVGGVAVAFAGLAYLLAPGLRAPDPVGAALMVVAGIGWAVYTLLGRGSARPLVDTAQNFILTVPLALVCFVALAWEPWTLEGILWAVASGALASGVGYAIWYAVLPGLKRTQAGIVQSGVPVIAAVGGILLLGEEPTLRLGIATVLILGGVAVAITVRPRPR
jgi:drug/metabolite transporter (DMT)-like permease